MRAPFRTANLTMCLSLLVIGGCVDYSASELDDADDAGASELEDKGLVGTYQAEDHSFQKGCTETSQNEGYTGSGYMDFGGKATIVEWNNVNAPSAGEYTLSFRYANGSGSDRQCFITVNDTNNASSVSFAKTGSWTTWATDSLKVTLRRGINKIRVTANTGNGGPNLDKMELIGAASPVGQCAVVDEGSKTTLACPSGQVIGSIAFASYGTPTGTCPNPAMSSCHASSSKSKVESLCLNETSCTVSASNGVFSDPCAGVRKQLAVSYTCRTTSAGGQCVEVDEGERTTLSCPSGKVIDAISFASYGTPTGTCPNPATSACHASSSKSKVESLCLNKASCTVGASNGTFSDPCPGVGKQLAVSYTCAATSTPQDMPVFLMAGQSNMEGHVDTKLFDALLGELGSGSSAAVQSRLKAHLSDWYLTNNDGYASYGYSDAMATLESSELIRLNSAGLVGSFLETPLSTVMCAMNDAQVSGLATNCGGPFGPELVLGHYLNAKGRTPTSLIKVAKGGTTLYTDWRSPRTVAQSGGSVGPLYKQLESRIDSLKSSPASVHPSCTSTACRWGAFIWFQGENDSFDQPAADAYAKNLTNLIADVRGRVGSSNLPVIVVEIGQWAQSLKYGSTVRSAQRAVVAADGNTKLVKTDDLSGFYHYDPAAQLIIGERLGITLSSMLGGTSDGCPSDPSKTAPGVCGCGVADTDSDRDGTADCKDGCKSDAAKTTPGLCGCGVPEGSCGGGGGATPSANHVGGYQSAVTSGGFVPSQYDAGYSMYVAAWPLFKKYPGPISQTGLFGTWMHTQRVDNPPIERMYSDIEGGLGWWRNTRFATETPKFIMGGVALNFSSIANGPGAGAGTWDNPRGLYGVAQLSPWVLFPPDGLNLKQGTSGELLGYGYLPLPLTNPKTVTAGKPVVTGNQCWTLFLNAGNFKGPVAFFLPYFFSKPSVDDPRLSGMFLDTLPASAGGQISMETQHTPAAQVTTSDGQTFARIAPLLFPSEADGTSVLVHNLYYYQKSALWDKVADWFAGRGTANGYIDPNPYFHRTFSRYHVGWAIWEGANNGGDHKDIIWDDVSSSVVSNPYTTVARWNRDWVGQTQVGGRSYNVLPEYYSLNKTTGKWTPVRPEEVPANSGLQNFQFPTPTGTRSPYTTPEGSTTSWKSPGPAAGPFYAYPGDGTRVTYYWYRFADQPAMLNADMTKAEREVVQKRVEMIHRSWTKERDYLAPPAVAKSLAQLDPALVVAPPAGLEVGYVPIVTRQELAK